MFRPLIRKGDFTKLIAGGRKFSSRHLLIYALPNGLPFSRLGISVSKKIGNAVVRNRIKRRLRESLRILLKENPLRCDLVIIAKKACADADFVILKKTVADSLADFAHESNFDIGNKTL